MNADLTRFLCSTVHGGGGRGGWSDLHGGGQTATWLPQQSDGESCMTDGDERQKRASYLQ